MNMLSGNSRITFITTGKEKEDKQAVSEEAATVSSVIKFSVNILCDLLCLSENAF